MAVDESHAVYAEQVQHRGTAPVTAANNVAKLLLKTIRHVIRRELKEYKVYADPNGSRPAPRSSIVSKP